MIANAPIKKKIQKEFGSLCYEYFIDEKEERYCRFYIGLMSKYSNYFSKVFFKELRGKGFDKNKTFFCYLDNFHPNGRGQIALNNSKTGFGTKILNEIIKDCKEKNVTLIFALASTDSAKSFFINRRNWIQAYPKKRGVCYKEI
jgi:hypothetical protein